jgi:hypothetical protein
MDGGRIEGGLAGDPHTRVVPTDARQEREVGWFHAQLGGRADWGGSGHLLCSHPLVSEPYGRLLGKAIGREHVHRPGAPRLVVESTGSAVNCPTIPRRRTKSWKSMAADRTATLLTFWPYPRLGCVLVIRRAVPAWSR